MRIVGIDPGSVRCGYGIVVWQCGQLQVVDYGVIELHRGGESLPERLRFLFKELHRILRHCKPDEAAVESTFYARNAQSLAKLAQARGVALLTLALEGIPVAEYAPRAVKQGVTGHGNATKEQVRYMVGALLGIEFSARFYDSSDALAVALCHAFRRLHSGREPAPRTWKAFLQRFPERILTPASSPHTR